MTTNGVIARVRLCPKSGHSELKIQCPLCAKGESRRNQISGIDSSARREGCRRLLPALSPHQRHEAVARREIGEALVEIGSSFTSATISGLAQLKGYIEGASAESFENSSGE